MNHQAIRRQLLARRGELLTRLGELSGTVHHCEQPLSADLTEQALELENLDVLFALDESSRHELQQINSTLQRLESGSYEHCAVCGDPIGRARLRALPFADTCIRCSS